uniref:Pentraxin (PTX) domain-containing protein n=1 Tax=Electrophorus electricus TaxID=8005 RepID=A0A4W4E7K8_ELEEL
REHLITGAPIFYGMTGVGTGATGSEQQVTYSRLICTPVPPGECKSKNFQADDQSLYAGEDWGYLRTTAEELRQTVLQQKDEIITDQRTIQELTGKLSECESGKKRSGKKVERDRLEMQDDARASASVLTSLVMEDFPLLENPRELNNLRVDDLEGELKRKMKLLEEERKALRKETEKHQQHIDHGLDTVHQRIHSLEQGLSENRFPEGYRLSFPVRSSSMYAMVKRAIPTLHAFTICMWIRPAQSILGTGVSYAVPEQTHELVLQQLVHGPTELIINNEVVQFHLNLTVGMWQHVCISWSRRGGIWHAYLGARLKGEGRELATRHSIRPGGTLVLGQEQSSMGGLRFEASRALVGELSQFNMWDRPLTHTELSALAHCSTSILGNVVPWTSREVEVFGGVTKQPAERCIHHASVRQ